MYGTNPKLATAAHVAVLLAVGVLAWKEINARISKKDEVRILVPDSYFARNQRGRLALTPTAGGGTAVRPLGSSKIRDFAFRSY